MEERQGRIFYRIILYQITEYAYHRPEDGIYILPIGCLKD